MLFFDFFLVLLNIPNFLDCAFLSRLVLLLDYLSPFQIFFLSLLVLRVQIRYIFLNIPNFLDCAFLSRLVFGVQICYIFLNSPNHLDCAFLFWLVLFLQRSQFLLNAISPLWINYLTQIRYIFLNVLNRLKSHLLYRLLLNQICFKALSRLLTDFLSL